MPKDAHKRLGRGLSSLISSITTSPTPSIEAPRDAPSPGAAMQHLRSILLDQISPNPMQPRRDFDPTRLQALADSLKANGTLQPVVVRQAGTGFQLVAGERRWRAAQLAGLGTISAIVRNADDETLLELALIENIQREALNAIERARGYLALTTRFGLSHEEIARRMGEGRTTVVNYIRILDLGDEVLDLVAAGKLTTGHCKALLALARPDEQVRLARRMSAESWSVRQAEQHVSRAASKQKPAPASRPVISDLESRFSTALGLKVQIAESRRKNSGRVIIDYHSLDDFERIVARLGLAAADSPQ